MPDDGFISFRFQTFNRRKEVLDSHGRTRIKRCSAVGKAAYQSGEKLYDDRLGCNQNYLHKAPGVINKAMVGYKGVKAKFLDRLKFWNMVDCGEPRKNAKLCRSIILSCEHRMSVPDQFKCLIRFAKELAEHYRIVCDVAHHSANPAEGHDNRNWHGHILMPRRAITDEGYLSTNESFKELDDIRLSAAAVRYWRGRWAAIQNEMFELRGIDVRIDPRSYEERGIEKIPSQHRGPGGQAQGERGIRPDSKIQLDAQGNIINWPEIDEGRTRPELNVEIFDLNAYRDTFGPLPLITQITNFDAWIEGMMERCADLEAIIPASMLPTWARLKVEHWRYKLQEFLVRAWREKEEEIEEQEERQRQYFERTGVLEQIRRMKEQIKELEEAKARREELLKFYMRVQAYCAMRAPIVADSAPARRVISEEQYNVELHFKAETARAKVPAEYRPRIERPSESLPSAGTGQGGQFTAAARAPPDNGGLAQAPPPMAPTFNAAANPGPEPYKQKVKVAFGPAAA